MDITTYRLRMLSVPIERKKYYMNHGDKSWLLNKQLYLVKFNLSASKVAGDPDKLIHVSRLGEEEWR